MIDKKSLRQEIRRRKRAYSSGELLRKSATVLQHLEQEKAFKQANTILIYWPLGDEVSTVELIMRHRKAKHFILPVIHGEDLLLKAFTEPEQMSREPHFGVEQPTGPVFDELQAINLAIVPGMAFDKEGNRLGRGKGYYDRFLPNKDFPKIGLCFDFQLVDKVPVSPHDMAMDLVISESNIIRLQ